MTKNDVNSKGLSSHPTKKQHGANKAHGKKCRVLLAQNNSISRGIHISTLTTFGHRVDVAANSLEVLKQTADNDYDIIILDTTLPDAEGTAISHKIRELEQSKHAYIAMITYCENCTISKAYSIYGINSCHAKFMPIDFLLKLTGDLD